MAKNLFIHQLALKADRHLLQTEEADYWRLDLPAHEHVNCDALVLPQKSQLWGSTKSFAVTALLLYAFFFTLTNAAAYGKIAVAEIQTLQQNQESKQTQEPLTITDAPAQTNAVAAENDLAALLPTPASTNDRIVIPSLKINAPIVEPSLGLEALKAQDFASLEEQIHETLLKGVVHYPGTAEPGQKGNALLTGHSSNVFWELSPYNTVFALLPKIQVGQDLYVTHNLTEYHYRVIDKKEVKPSDVSVFAQGEDHHLTLVTCTPVGTTFRRLIVTAELVQD